MKKILVFFMVTVSVTAIAFGQEIDKLSAGTKMFLMMRADEAKNGTLKTQTTVESSKFKIKPEVKKGYKMGFAPTEVVGNVEMIDAFIYLTNPSNVSSIEAHGAKVMCKFDKFVTAKIPVNRIEEISNLSDVVQIDVSRLLQPKTDVASSVTNTDKAWDGINNGLCDEYTGKGVIVGVIDQGIHFKHTAFNDDAGNSRVKRVYAPGRSSSVYTSNFPDYDVTTGSHGTHTSTTAGGRAVTINGTTYSGMAPESDLFLCGLNSLSSINIANSLSYINDYATQQGQPCVVNISLGSQYGAHDGTGSLAAAYSGFTSNGTAAGRLICLAAGNEAGGNMYFGGTATSSTPACTALEHCIYSDIVGTYTYYYSSSYYADYFVWPSVAGATLKFQFVVIDKRTKSIVATTDAVTPGSNGSSVTLSSTYFNNGSVNVTRGTDNYSGKYYYEILVRGTTKESTNSMSTDSDGNYISRYAVGMLVYSATNSSVKFDCWGDGFSEFMDSDYAGTYGNYTFTKGSDECSIGNEVPTSGVISVGAYVSKKSVTTSNNVSFISDEYTVGDIAPFSSYSTGCGPDGIVYPDITAPGAILVAGVNKYDTSNYPSSQSSSDEYMTIGNASDGSRYGSMSGTSMATPTATGIMALWLQANPNLTSNQVKGVLNATGVRDSYVNGANSAHFGKYGKLDALAGLKYIAPCEDVPLISASPTSVAFGDQVAGGTYTKTFTVTGTNLEGNITLAKSGSSSFTIDITSVTKATAEGNGATITVTFKPTAYTTADYTGTVTLTSSNATAVTVNLTGKGIYTAPSIAASPTSLSFTGNSGQTYTKTVTVTGSNLQGNITAAISDDANGFYSVSPTSFSGTSQTVTVTWAPTAGGTSTANLVLTTTGTGANSVTVPITGTAQGPTITASPTQVTFTGAYATRTYTQTVTVTGTNLSGNITAAISGANVYSIDKTSLSKTGGTITVTYAPIAAGNTNATLTLSSTGASSVTVPITGVAQAATPTLIVSPSALSFTDGDRAKTFAVTGRFITDDVTLTLNDASGAFTLGTATIPSSSISETDAVNVTVTFNAEDEGDYTGSVTVSSNGATSQTINLSASISNGGTASDAYLNIAKYATIDEAGWNTSLVNKIYEYKEYDSDEVAWLTLPMYGAFVGAKYSATSNTISSGHPQAWIETSVTQSTQCGQTSWSATDIYLGSSNYFTSTTAEAVGTNSRTSTTEKAVTFYVTNTTAVKLYASQRSNSTTYPTTLKIYECTVNGDGTLTSSSSTVKNGSLTTSGAGSISLTELDASKVYKVVASQARGYLYEIGFQTPISKPTLTASPTGIDFIAEPGETITETITVTGVHLTEDVTVTLTDENGVYTLDKSSISIAEATNGATVTVTFNAPQAMGSYRGQATFTSGQASAKTVFYGAVGEKGSAYSNYLDIAQYQTIATGNWYDGIFANAYKWTEYEDDECAWLTLPAALPYYAWNYNDQNWCGVSSNSTGGWYGHQWTATDVFQGYEYFKRADLSDENGDYAHMMGGDESNSTSNTTIFYGIYNVTNCTQVKAYAYNNGATSTYPAFIQIYELTENADGTLTQSETRTDIQRSTTSGAVTMTSAELDASKIYFVAVGGYRGFTYEVAFRTPLTTTTATLAQIEASGVKNQKYKVSDKLLAVYAAGDQGILWCKDLNNASNAPTYQTDGQYDYMRDIVGEQSVDWDQSNWVALQFSQPDSENGVKALVTGAVGSYIKAGTIVGTYSDANNYTITMAEDALQLENCDEEYVKNVYCTANFLPGNLNINGGLGALGRYHGEDAYYFFMNPKVQEVCEITYAQWDGTKFVVPDNDSQVDGAFTVDWSLNEEGPRTPTIDEAYRFTAVVNRTQNSSYLKGVTGEPSSDFVVSPLDFVGTGDQVITAINGIFTDGYREVVGVDYVNVAGMISDKPFQGVNIVVTRYSDGSKTTEKKVFK